MPAPLLQPVNHPHPTAYRGGSRRRFTGPAGKEAAQATSTRHRAGAHFPHPRGAVLRVTGGRCSFRTLMQPDPSLPQAPDPWDDTGPLPPGESLFPSRQRI